MSDIHQRFFALHMMELDGRLLNPEQRDELQAHLATCPSCQTDLQLYQRLRAQAGRRWPVVSTQLALDKVPRGAPRRAGLRWVTLPLRTVIWVGVALLVLVLIRWIITDLRPTPAVIAPADQTPTVSAPVSTLTATLKGFDSPAEKILTGSLLQSKGREDYDYFGGSLDIDGSVLVTGAPLWNSPGMAAGRAYIFRKSAEGEWLSEATLTASDWEDESQSDQHFGASVAVNSTDQLLQPVVAVSAPGADDPQAGDNIGAVYIYEYDGSNWVEIAKLTPSRIPEGKIGREIVLSGNILAVSGAPEAGEIYTFQRETGGWRELDPVTVPASPEGGPASVRLDLYGDTLALCTFSVPPVNRETFIQSPQRTGIITLYERSGDQWKLVFQTPPQHALAPITSDGFTPWDENPFGIQVSIGGEGGQASWLALGKPGGTTASIRYGGESGLESTPGSVVLYERGEHGWAIQTELKLTPGELAPGALPIFSSDPAAVFFGADVEIAGNRLAVIATFANTVDVFEKQGQDWVYLYRLSPGADYLDDFQLRTVAMSGSTLLLGSPGELGSGCIFVFSLPSKTIEDLSSQDLSQVWPTPDPDRMILPDGLKAYDNFGAALAYDEDLLAVGAPNTDLETGRNAGVVYLFKRSGDGWQQVARLTPESIQADSRFGSTLAIAGDILVVGAPYEYNPGTGNASGAVYVFTHSKDQWEQMARLSAPDGQPFDLFGSALALKAGDLAVGARAADGSSGRDTGAVYLYHKEDENWTLRARLGEEAAAFDHFGQALAFAGDDLLIGAPDADPDQVLNGGQVYVYRQTDGSWSEHNHLTANESRSQARFGAALSAQGDQLAVVAPQEYQKPGPMPPYAFAYEAYFGTVHIFERKGDSWQWQARLFPEPADEQDAVYASSTVITILDGQARLAIGGFGRGGPFIFEQRDGSWQALPELELPDWISGDGMVAAGGQILLGSRFYDAPQPGGGGDAIWSGGVVWIIDW